MKTKTFDLEAAKRGELICQGDGTPLRFVAIVPELVHYPVWCVRPDGGLITFTMEGHFFASDARPKGREQSAEDALMVVKTKTVWVNLYWTKPCVQTSGSIFDTEQEAVDHRTDSCLRTVSVEVPTNA